MTPTRAELEQLAQSPEGMKRYTIVDPCHQWQYHEHREGMWVKHEDADAELTALREAVRVLGEECWMWRLTNDFVDRDTHGRYGPQKQAMAKTNANPIALAAVEKAG